MFVGPSERSRREIGGAAQREYPPPGGMMKRILLYALLAVAAAHAQTLGLTPDFVQQFSDNNGLPLAGGLVYTCAAGQTCPGTPQPTYTDASGFTINSDPVVLDANGRPQAGGGIWLGCLSNYKLVLANSAGVVIKTADNVSCAAFGGGTTTTNYWTLTGSGIANTNSSGAGNVSIGGGLTVNNSINVNGGLALRSSAGTPHNATIQAASVMPGDQTWRWPSVDISGCLSSDGLGTLSFITCGGGGGGGSPGGNASDVQFSTGSAFGGSDNFQWQNASQRIVITGVTNTPGIVVVNGWIQADGGFDATVVSNPSAALSYNIIQAPTGGMHALSFTADKYVESGSSSGAPSATTGDAGFPHAGTLYCDTSSSPCVEKLYNGSAWITLATGGATSPGGSNTNIQFNSSGSFAGSGNLLWSNASQLLTVSGSSSALPGIHVGNGYVDSDYGFVALPGTSTQFNSIRATAGGMAANSFTATTYVQSGHSPGPFSTAPPTPTTSDVFAPGALSFDVAANAEKVYNGSAWVTMGGGGGGTPGGPTTSVQYNNGGTFGGDANLIWNSAAQVLTATGLSSGYSINAVNSFIHSDLGFLASNGIAPTTQLPYNTIQVPFGGVFGQSMRAKLYMTTGSNNGIPTVSSGDAFAPGSMYFDTGINAERVFNGTTWSSLAGAVASVNTLTGALTVAGTANQINVSSVGATITLSTPQNINTNSNVVFASMNTTSTINVGTGLSGGAFAITAGSGGPFIVHANGTVDSTVVNGQAGSGTAFQVTSSVDPASIQTPGGISLCSSGACTGSVALKVNGINLINAAAYYLGPISTPISGSPSTIYIGSGGNFWTRAIGNDGGLSCSGVPDGFFAVASNPSFVTCMGGVRYKVALVAY